MHAELKGSEYVVTVDNHEVTDFMAAWPASGLDEDAGYRFHFSAENGDLLDSVALRDGVIEDDTHTDDGSALVALSEDACKFGAETLGLDDVIAVKFPSSAPGLA